MNDINKLELEKIMLEEKLRRAKKPALLKAFALLTGFFSILTLVIIYIPSKRKPHDSLVESYGFENCVLFFGGIFLILTIYMLLTGYNEKKAHVFDIEAEIASVDFKISKIKQSSHCL